MLGRFVYSLNRFCKEKYDMDYDVDDYHIYEFAKVSRRIPNASRIPWFQTLVCITPGCPHAIAPALTSCQQLRHVCKPLPGARLAITRLLCLDADLGLLNG